MNKKIVFLILFIVVFNVNAFSQDENTTESNYLSSGRDGAYAFAIGIGPEFNMNSRENFAGGAALNIDFNIPAPVFNFAAGLTVTCSYNLSDTYVLETTGMFRWYFLGINHTGLFAQADLGLHLISERDVIKPMFEGGLRGGFRIPLGDTPYIEPYGRFGYPYFWGVGVLAGMRFPSSSKSSNNNYSGTGEEG